MTITNQSSAVLHLAGVCGWKVRRVTSGPGTKGMMKLVKPDLTVAMYWPECGVNGWNPAVSRDDCAEVEDRLTTQQREGYIAALAVIKLADTESKIGWHWFLLTAPPSVRFPALCEATGYREDA